VTDTADDARQRALLWLNDRLCKSVAVWIAVEQGDLVTSRGRRFGTAHRFNHAVRAIPQRIGDPCPLVPKPAVDVGACPPSCRRDGDVGAEGTVVDELELGAVGLYGVADSLLDSSAASTG
jgi:hypothetical protein